MKERPIKELPIIFSAAEVRAILEGRKTQTRRLKKGSYWRYDFTTDRPTPDSWREMRKRHEMPNGPVGFCAYDSPYGRINDRLWVREAWWQGQGPTWGAHCVVYDADRAVSWAPGSGFDNPDMRQFKPFPSCAMPRWASRITLEIDRVLVYRLQTMEDRDAIAEGIRELPLQEGQPGAWWAADPTRPELHGRSPVNAYAKLWRSIHGPDSWDANPWVWVLSFHKLEAQP